MNKKIIIISIIAVILLVVGLILFVSFGSNGEQEDFVENSKPGNSTGVVAPSKVGENEKEVSSKKKQELFDFIPKVYIEGVAPFTSSFMLDAVMKKMIESNELEDLSAQTIDKQVTKIFGEQAKINKEEVAVPDVAKSLFYYSKEAGSYAIIPVGYEGKFEYQILKNVTETDDAYYVYVYTLIGGYAYDENSLNQDEFGDIDYENAKVQVIVGDKDGNDLVHVFDNYTLMYDESAWLKNYSNVMPIFRYTLTKSKVGCYLTEIEHVNY